MSKKQQELKVEEALIEELPTEILVEELPTDKFELKPKQVELAKYYSAMINNEPYILPTYVLASVQDRILKWNLVRGNTEFNALKEVEMYEEELDEENLAMELLTFAENQEELDSATYERIDALCDKYVIFTGTLAKSGMVEAPLMELARYYEDYLNITKTVKELGFDFIKCMSETLFEIESRQQDPEQKLLWEQRGSNGEKWQKWKEQPEDTLYKANYSKCRI